MGNLTTLVRKAFQTADITAFVAVIVQGFIAWYAFGVSGLALFASVIVGVTFASAYKSAKGKAEASADEPRSWKNALANTGVGTVICILSLGFIGPAEFMIAGFASSLGAGLADTFSHEFGVLWGGKPFLITSFRTVPAGTNGAVSLIGSAAGVLTAIGFAVCSVALFNLSWFQMGLIFAGQCLGNLADTILGATLERRELIDNNIVNFSCTLSAALFVVVVNLLCK